MAVPKITSKGKEVLALQWALNKFGSTKLEPDSVFGKVTETALKKFQKKKSLKPDGVAGASTLAVLGLGPSLRIPKMPVEDYKGELAYWKDKGAVQGAGGPEKMAREIAGTRKALGDIEKKFLTMFKEVNTIQKEVLKQRDIVLAAVSEVVKYQSDDAGFVKERKLDDASLAAQKAKDACTIFDKAQKKLGTAQDQQSKIYNDRFVPLIDKTFQ